MKRFLTLYALFLILTGCSEKPSTLKKNELHVKHGDNKLTQNTTHSFPKSKTLQPSPTSATKKIILDVPLISQKPELKYGCEVTSLAMVLQHAGIKVNKMDLANEIKKDPTPLSTNKSGDIIQWGDPKEGFVGDITGKNKGYAVHVQPLQELMERYLPNRTVNLTGKTFNTVLAQIKLGKPVVVWTTGDYRLPDRWESWKHDDKKITAPLDLHAVVIVGLEDKYIYINDPLTVKKGHKVSQDIFIQSWEALGKQALSYR